MLPAVLIFGVLTRIAIFPTVNIYLWDFIVFFIVLFSLKKIYRFLKKKNKYHLYYPSYFEFRDFLKKNNFEVLKCVGAGKLRNFPVLSSVDFYIIKPAGKIN